MRHHMSAIACHDYPHVHTLSWVMLSPRRSTSIDADHR
jgi:hypothetical protein